MKRIILFTAALTCVATTKAQEVTDTLKQQHLEEVIVAGVRVQKNAPYAVANIKKSELEAFSKTGRELPFSQYKFCFDLLSLLTFQVTSL